MRRLLRLMTVMMLFLSVQLTGMAFFSATAQAAPARGGAAFGVQFHAMWSQYDDRQRGQVLDTLRDSGAEWVRIDVSWAMLQPTSRDAYDAWGVNFVDRVIAMARARGLKPLVTLWMTPKWANGGASPQTLPTDVQDYARVAKWA